MVTSYERGHEIYWDGSNWRYFNNRAKIDSEIRVCARCGMKPTVEGYDACIGYVKGGKSICCGHGKSDPIRIMAPTHLD